MGCLHSKVNDVSAHQSHKLSLLMMKCSEIIHSRTDFSGTQEIFIQILYFYICLLTLQHVPAQKEIIMSSGCTIVHTAEAKTNWPQEVISSGCISYMKCIRVDHHPSSFLQFRIWKETGEVIHFKTISW